MVPTVGSTPTLDFSHGRLFIILASAHMEPLTEAFPDTHIKIIPYHFYYTYTGMSSWIIFQSNHLYLKVFPFIYLFIYVFMICLPQLDFLEGDFLEGR